MARRGFKFTVVEIEHLLEAIEDVVPIGNPDWERIGKSIWLVIPQRSGLSRGVSLL